jgi:hypothetical protein
MLKNIRAWKNDVKISVAALFVSLIAIVLSQFHPLYTYLDKPALDVDLSRLQFYQSWGKVGFGAFVELSNDGRAAGRVSQIDIFIEPDHDASHQLRLQVQTYYPIPPSISMGSIATQVPWSPVILAPDGTWTFWVNCFAALSDEESTTIDELTAETQRQFASAPAAPVAPGVPRAVDDALFHKMTSFAVSNLNGFSSGKYSAIVAFWGLKREKPLTLKAYSFSVPSSYQRLFATGIGQLKFGMGIVSPPQVPQGPVMTLTPVRDKIAIEALRKDFGF